MTPTLYLVATPIGNFEDMTFRALEVLRAVDLVVCEERKEGARLLHHFKVDKPLETLNEHNEAAATHTILEALAAGKSVALISDCGTPVFSDPGYLLVHRAAELNIRIVPLPGASSLMPALTVSGFSIDKFLYYGWLSPKKERRRAELRQLVRERRTIVLMDTPYRLVSLLQDLADAFGKTRRVCIAYNLTLPDEQIFRGDASMLAARFTSHPIKGEFVIIIEGTPRES
jgi:16S rRNA (cytidine1402-2'-O)-methyltransferase